MNVILVGPVENKACTFVGVYKSLLRIGLQVLPINTNNISNENKINSIIEDNITPEQTLVLFLTEGSLYTSSPKICQKIGGVSWTFHNEIDTTKHIIEFSKHSFVNSYSCRKILYELENNGIIINNILIPEGFDNDIYKPIFNNINYECDISLIGNRVEEFYKDNIDLLQEYNCRFYSNLVDDTILPIICASSKIIIYNDTSIYTKEYYPIILSKMLGCGSYLICNNPEEYLNNYLIHGKDCVFLSGDTNLEKALSVKDYERKQLIPFSRDRAVKLLNWTAIVERIIKTIVKK